MSSSPPQSSAPMASTLPTVSATATEEEDVEMASAIKEVMEDAFGSESDSSSDESDGSPAIIPLANLRRNARAKWHQKNVQPDDGVLVSGPPGSHPHMVAQLFSEVESSISGVQSESQTAVDDSSKPSSESAPSTGKRFTRSEAAKALAQLSQPTKRSKRSSHSHSSGPSLSSPITVVEGSSPVVTSSEPSPFIECNDIDTTFRSGFHKGMWPFVCARNIYREYSVDPAKLESLGLLDHILDMGFGKTVLNVPSFVRKVVLEFYSNLSSDIAELPSDVGYTTFVRGEFVKFSPAVINQFLGTVIYPGPSPSGVMNTVVSELTGGLICSWPQTGRVRASALSHRYSVLHKIALHNWMPSSHRSTVRADLALFLYNVGTKGCIDFGQFVFDHVMDHAEAQVSQKPIGFPSLLFGLIMSQVDVTSKDDVYEPETPKVVLTDKLKNASYHVNDIPDPIISDSTVVHTSSTLSHGPLSAGSMHSRICQEISSEITHLSRVIKSSQERRSFLSSLLADIQGESSAVLPETPGSSAVPNASAPVSEGHDASKQGE